MRSRRWRARAACGPPCTPAARKGAPVAVRLGIATEDLSYAIDLGLPQLGPFTLDPEIKSEVVWAGPVLRPSTVLTERTGLAGPHARRRRRVDDRPAHGATPTSR